MCHLMGVTQGEKRLALKPWDEIIIVVPKSHKNTKVKRQY